MNITLHNIFRYLLDDDSFLSKIIETDESEFEKKKQNNKFNLMTDMITEYKLLSPHEIQEYSLFPPKIKDILSPDYIRFGIKNVIEKNLNYINISFLGSLNILLRPEIYKLNIDDQIKNMGLLENFICDRIRRNYRIDRVKNTKKIQSMNKELIKNLNEGKISHELIQTIINIFEINLLIFDLNKIEINLYWTKGTKYPYFNIFKDLYCMSYIQGNYEPIFPADKLVPKQQIQKMYTYILSNVNEIKVISEINISIPTLIILNSWNIEHNIYIDILKKFYNKPIKTIDDYLLEFNIFENK